MRRGARLLLLMLEILLLLRKILIGFVHSAGIGLVGTILGCEPLGGSLAQNPGLKDTDAIALVQALLRDAFPCN